MFTVNDNHESRDPDQNVLWFGIAMGIANHNLLALEFQDWFRWYV